MQLAKVMPCLVLAACSSIVEDLPQKEHPAPFLSTSILDLKKAAAEAKLAEPLEVAGPIEAHPISSAPWIICLRSGASEQSSRRVYSVFFKDSRYDSMRLSVIVDRCEEQTFVPLRDE
jgi:hypothetical protein